MRGEEPKLIPHKGGHRVHVAVKKTLTDIRVAFSSLSAWIYASTVTEPPERFLPTESSDGKAKEILAHNHGDRIDWVIQESPGEAVSEWVSAVSSHFCYWNHDDVAEFVINRINLEKLELKSKKNFI